jgi:hypothetical protein
MATATIAQAPRNMVEMRGAVPAEFRPGAGASPLPHEG